MDRRRVGLFRRPVGTMTVREYFARKVRDSLKLLSINSIKGFFV